MHREDRPRRRLRRALLVLTALVAPLVVVPVIGPADGVEAASVPAGASRYVAVAPDRLADTRVSEGAYGFTRLSSQGIRVQVTGRFGVPAEASAAVLTITAVNAPAAGWVAAYPSGTPLPLASTLNVDQPFRIIANLSTVRLGADGAVELFSNVPMDLVVDVSGAYVPVDGPVAEGRLVTFAGGARRAIDTRVTLPAVAPQGVRSVSLAGVGVPAEATAVVLNVGVTEALPGYWTVYSAGSRRPPSSNTNIDRPGQTRNSQAIVRLEPGTQAIDVFSQSGGHLIIDVVGYMTGAGSEVSTDGLFVPRSTPLRVLDTRKQYAIAPWGGSTIEFDVKSPFPTLIAAAALNVTATEPLNMGYVTAFPAGVAPPFVANLNVESLDQTIANHAIVRLGTRGGSLFTQSGTQLIVDVAGWYLGTADVSGAVAPNPDYGVTTASRIRSAVLNTPIGYGPNIDPIVDRGLAGMYAGLGRLGVPEHNVFFAHRTEAGGPFRRINEMQVGDTFTVTGANGHQYIYRVMETAIINPIPSVLMALATRAGTTTVTLVACHPLNSIRQRIVVTGRLVGAV
jgi:LPXTG-site transpeptidase (sortase) family protein